MRCAAILNHKENPPAPLGVATASALAVLVHDVVAAAKAAAAAAKAAAAAAAAAAARAAAAKAAIFQ